MGIEVGCVLMAKVVAGVDRFGGGAVVDESCPEGFDDVDADDRDTDSRSANVECIDPAAPFPLTWPVVGECDDSGVVVMVAGVVG